ncbi:MAG: hydantoinase/oxoprolinase family protein [Candidatus Acetothermia bacterium]|nr:hydantoinase/oxoprolinase family protein [Candidatus Acetothermia bacterium]MDH7505448.1 hydantoinase/oxoprolinase family protein [Candidatus Acetothermia bacterium]
MFRISTDVGGTFTDGVMLDEDSGALSVSKVLSTPQNPAIGTVRSVEKFGISLDEVSFFVHGTTVVINALIEGKGAKTSLITTRGFRDVLEIGRSNRTEMYDALYRKPRPLVPRYLRFEVTERIAADGEILVPLNADDLAMIIDQLRREGVESVAVCFLNAYANPDHEQQVGQHLREHCPGITVSLSHNITRRYYEYERTSTTVQNAYVMPVVQTYLRSLEQQLAERRFGRDLQIMQSNGGVMTSAVAREIPIAMVESGPAAGAIGAAQLAALLGYENVISYDMGGTTAKTSIIRGGLPETTDQYLVEGRPLLLPVVDLREIGAGGGSIAWIDEAGALHVGPQSAGADPGPACYMAGGSEPTVTDANLQLGILDPAYFLGGEMEISPQLAQQAIEKIASRFGLTADEAALGIIKIVNTNMAGLLQSMTVKRGYDPREFAVVAFGGAGPIHATAIARELSIPTVIVPVFPGVFSAWGMLMADLRHDFARTYIEPLNGADATKINQMFRDLERQVKGLFERENIENENIVLTYEMDLRYSGQEHTLGVPAPAKMTDADKEGLGRAFDEAHYRVYGHNAPDEAKEIVSLKVIGIGKVKKPILQALKRGRQNPAAQAKIGKRRVYVGNGRYQEFSIYRRDRLLAGNVIPGPAIIEEPTATTVVESDQTCSVDQYGNLVISLS